MATLLATGNFADKIAYSSYGIAGNGTSDTLAVVGARSNDVSVLTIDLGSETRTLYVNVFSNVVPVTNSNFRYGIVNNFNITNPAGFSTNIFQNVSGVINIGVVYQRSANIDTTIFVYDHDNTDGVISIDTVKETIDNVRLPANTAGGATNQTILDRVKAMFD